MSERIVPVRFTPEISAGAVLQALTVGGAVMAYVFGVAGKTDQSLEASRVLRADMTTQLADMRSQMSAGFTAVQAQIAGLPDQRAQLADLTRRADRADQRAAEIDGRLDALTTQAAQVRSDVDGLLSASGRRPGRTAP